jgi:hypothetical protein
MKPEISAPGMNIRTVPVGLMGDPSGYAYASGTRWPHRTSPDGRAAVAVEQRPARGRQESARRLCAVDWRRPFTEGNGMANLPRRSHRGFASATHVHSVAETSGIASFSQTISIKNTTARHRPYRSPQVPFPPAGPRSSPRPGHVAASRAVSS